MPSSIVESMELGRQAARQREEDAYVKSRRPIENAFADKQSEQTIARNDQVMATTAAQEGRAAQKFATDEERTASDDRYTAGALFNEAIARQIEANPNLKPSEIMASAPDVVKKRVGLDSPEAQAHFAEIYDKNPAQLRADAQMYGGKGRALKSSEAVEKDGVDGFLQTFEDGTTNFVPGYAKKASGAAGAFTLGDTRYDANGDPIVVDTGAVQRAGAAKAAGAVTGKDAGQEAVDTGPRAQRKADSIMRQNAVKLDELKDNVALAKDQITEWSAGLAAHGKNVGAAPANLASTLTSIRARIGLDALQDLKAQGVTLGQVTEAEHTLLQGLVADLAQIQDPKVLHARLDQIERHANKMWDLAQQDYAAQFKKGGGAAPAAGKKLVYDPATGELR